VDIVFGGVGTALILVALAEAGEKINGQLLNDHGMRLSLAGLIVYQVLFTIWEIMAHKSGRAAGKQVKVSVGMRGLGLFLLMFLMVMLADGWAKGTPGTRIAMLLVNGGIVLLGLGTMFGPLFIRQETAWLKDYLNKRNLTPEHKKR
jgi:hypothetical protein